MSDVILHTGKHFTFIDREGWEWVRRTQAKGVVAVAALTASAEVVLVRQYRPPLQAHIIELPAGLWGDHTSDETPEDAARRELLEETGFSGGHWSLAWRGPVSAGLTDEQVWLFLATDVVKIEEGGGVDGEEIEVFTYPLDSAIDHLTRAVADDVLIDHKVFEGILALLQGVTLPTLQLELDEG